MLALSITAVGDRAKALYNVFDGLAEVSYKIVGFIMNVAPIGVFGLITPVVAANGPAVQMCIRDSGNGDRPARVFLLQQQYCPKRYGYHFSLRILP